MPVAGPSHGGVPGIWPVNLEVVKSLLIAVRWACLFFLAFSGLVFFYNNMSLLFIFFSDMEKASLFHVAAGIVFMITVGGVGVIDWLDPVQKTAARSAGVPLSPTLPETRHTSGSSRGIRWRGHAISVETLMIGLLAATGGIMVFSGSPGSRNQISCLGLSRIGGHPLHGRHTCQSLPCLDPARQPLMPTPFSRHLINLFSPHAGWPLSEVSPDRPVLSPPETSSPAF